MFFRQIAVILVFLLLGFALISCSNSNFGGVNKKPTNRVDRVPNDVIDDLDERDDRVGDVDELAIETRNYCVDNTIDGELALYLGVEQGQTPHYEITNKEAFTFKENLFYRTATLKGDLVYKGSEDKGFKVDIELKDRRTTGNTYL